MNTFKVRRRLAAILLGLAGAGVAVFGTAAPASADVIWVHSVSAAQAVGADSAATPDRDVIWV
ncbi:hypothetical protein R8Z50_02545 [Longispora sp. K20-0274]|uniref:hypothetical protein n=1 Tax=Longispora sp. K20-0274 TaxID=3088255 RepID=UPI003999DE32